MPVIDEPDLMITSGEEEEIDLEAETEVSYQMSSYQGEKKLLRAVGSSKI